MKKSLLILALTALLLPLAGCSQRGMYDASNWWQGVTGGRNPSYTIEKAATGMNGSPMQRSADSVSLYRASEALEPHTRNPSLTVEKAATSLNDVNRKPKLSFYGAARAIRDAQR